MAFRTSALPRRFVPWFFMALAFAGVGVMRWPLPYVALALAPFAIGLAWRKR